MEFEGKHEGAHSNSASSSFSVKKFEGKLEGIPSNLAANSCRITMYMSHVFPEVTIGGHFDGVLPNKYLNSPNLIYAIIE